MDNIWLDSDLSVRNVFSSNYTASMIAKASFFYIQGIGHFNCLPEYYTKREGYKSYLLIYTLKGKGHAVYRDKKYELTKGTLLLMDCNDYQEYYTDKEDLWEFKWFHFYGGNSHSYFNLIYENYGPVVNMKDDQSVHNKISAIMNLIKISDIQLEVKVSSIIVQILTAIILFASGENYAPKTKVNSSYISNAIIYMEDNYHLDITLSDIASSVSVSIYHFIRIFKRITGYSPYEYLTKQRITNAKIMLEKSDMSVENIAYSVGFKSTSNFIQVFRKSEEMTPLKYRKYWEGK